MSGTQPNTDEDGGVPHVVTLRAIVECARAADCTSDQLASLIEPLPEFASRVERIGTVRAVGTDFPAHRGLERSVMNLGKDRVALLALTALALLGKVGGPEVKMIVAEFDALMAEDAARSFTPQVIRTAFAGKSLEFVRESNRTAVAFLYDSKGNRLLSHRFDVDQASLQKMLEALCLESVKHDELEQLKGCLHKLAA